jgi:predicted DNA-binding transcriptional regulator YafY
MAFGQASGPPASARQMQELLALLQDAGHDGFRDARGPLGFTQRQAAGKFTRDEAAALIERLQEGAPAEPVARLSAAERAVQQLPTEVLAAELQRRGWIVAEP